MIKKTIVAVVLMLSLCSCGVFEAAYDEANYESLTNEKGTIEVLSGGVVVRTFENAKVLYSSSDTQAMWIKCDGKKYYIQGDCVIKLK